MPSDGGSTGVLRLFEVADTAPDPTFELDRLIEQFRKPRNVDWSVPEAFLCLLLSAAMSDGHMAVEEQAEIETLSRRSRALKPYSVSQLATVNANISLRLRTRPEGLREACESLPTDMRLPLFAHCVDIVLADGVLLPVEVDFLNRVMKHLSIDPAEGRRVMEVLLIKNRF